MGGAGAGLSTQPSSRLQSPATGQGLCSVTRALNAGTRSSMGPLTLVQEAHHPQSHAVTCLSLQSSPGSLKGGDSICCCDAKITEKDSKARAALALDSGSSCFMLNLPRSPRTFSPSIFFSFFFLSGDQFCFQFYQKESTILHHNSCFGKPNTRNSRSKCITY